MFKIKKVEIEGFRGFTQKNTIELENPIILLYGGNHQGKSSVLNAIEWCLYGDECIGKKSGIRERVGTGEMSWRVVNDNSEKAQVKLELKKDEGHFLITRTEEKGKGRKGKKLRIYLPNGTEIEGDEASYELARLLRLTFKDFSTSIHQHQETIHDFIIKKPSEQSDAMDRLLGLSDYRNIIEGIRKSDVTKIQKELSEEFSRFQSRVQAAINTRQNDMKDKKDKAKEKGLNEEELNEKKLLELAQLTVEDINNFANLLNLKSNVCKSLSNWEDTESFISDTKKECDRLWAESPDVKEQSEKQDKRSDLISSKSKYSTQLQNVKKKEKELQNFERENGKRKEIEGKIKKTNEDIKNIDKKIKQTTPKARLVKEGISILESAVPPQANICPLCGKEKPNLLDHLKKEWEEKILAKLDELNNQRESLEKTKNGFEKIKKEHERLLEEVGDEKKRLEKNIKNISTFFNKKLREKDDPATILFREIGKIDKRLNKIKEAIQDKRKRINYINEKTESINLLYEILLLKDKIKEIEKIKNTEEFQKQEKIKEDISNLVKDVNEISKIVRYCMQKEAEEKIESAKNAIDYFFRKITNNPAFQRLNVKVKVDARTGINYYIFEDQDGKRPIPILSQGDLNSLALSIFLGLAKTSEDSHPLGFILMDDPSQSLDSQQKARFIETLNELSKIKEIIVSTMDTELHSLLKNKITKMKNIYSFSNWEPKSGPVISKEL